MTVDGNYMLRVRYRFEKKFTIDVSGCWNWTGSLNRGYGMIKYKGSPRLAHRISWVLYRGSIPIDMLVLHKCNNTSCVNPEHLYIGTKYDNILDSIRAGTCHAGKLNEFDVVCVKRMLRDKIPRWLISWIYKVTQPSISCISTGKSWRRVTI